MVSLEGEWGREEKGEGEGEGRREEKRRREKIVCEFRCNMLVPRRALAVKNQDGLDDL